MLEHRKAYESNFDAQLAQWKADLDVLKAKGKRAEVDVRVGYDKAIDALEQKHDEAGQHLHDLKHATDEAWESVKDGAEKARLDIKSLFQSSFKKP